MHKADKKIMKIPFYTIMGPVLRKNKLCINYLCVHPAMVFAPAYVGALGVFGVVIFCSVHTAAVKHAFTTFSFARLPFEGAPEKGKNYISRDGEGLQAYILGPVSGILPFPTLGFTYSEFEINNPIFYMPFLALYALIISLEFLTFIARIFVDGLNLQKRTLIMPIFVVYNWLSVACTFARLVSYCDM